jgi:hypothetical protein
MTLSLDWATIGPLLLGAGASVLWWMLRTMWAAIRGCASQAVLDKVEARLDTELRELAFKLDRYEESCAARYVEHSK